MRKVRDQQDQGSVMIGMHDPETGNIKVLGKVRNVTITVNGSGKKEIEESDKTDE